MLISVREEDPRPIYAQIIAEIKSQIRDGRLRPGDELPSVRELGNALGINLHTVHKAYQTLRAQGVIRLRLGQRAKVAQRPEKPLNQAAAESHLRSRLRELVTDAYHLGVSPDAFRRLVDETLER